MAYQSSYTGAQVDAVLAKLHNKDIGEEALSALAAIFTELTVTIGGANPPAQATIDALVALGLQERNILWAQTILGSPSSSPSSSPSGASASSSPSEGTPSSSASSSPSEGTASSSPSEGTPSSSASSSPSEGTPSATGGPSDGTPSNTPSSSVSSSPSSSASSSPSEGTASGSPSSTPSSSPSASPSDGTPSATGGGGNSFTEGFSYTDGNIETVSSGVWTVLSGTPSVASNSLVLNADEAASAATTMSRGFLFSMNSAFNGFPDAVSESFWFRVIFNSANSLSTGNRYEVQIQYIYDDEIPESYVNVEIFDNGTSISTGNYFTPTNALWRFTIALESGGNIVVKADEGSGVPTTTIVTVNDSTHTDFAYLIIGANNVTGGVIANVDNVIISDL